METPRQAASGYADFVLANRHLLGFGFTMTFASSVGQTFFIGAFGPAIRGEFDLSHTTWSSIYLAGTLLSALCLPWSGQLIDRFRLRPYTLVVLTGLVGAALFMAVVPHVWVLVAVIFCLRQTGQGLASHVAITTMARHFGAGRGKAVALASLGYAAGESILPFLVVLGIAAIGWRQTYAGAAVALVVVILPLILWLLGRHDRMVAAGDVGSEGAPRQAESAAPARSWTRREMLRHWRFYCLLPAVVAPSFIGTALFFHHLALAEAKGWSAVWITGSYWVYAVGSVSASLAAGPLIDRISAVRVVPVFLLPMAAALMLIWAFDNPFWAWPYLLLLGTNVGIAYTGLTALWAEIYGVGHIGAIRSLIVALSVLASALGPLGMGSMMDGGVSIEAICAIFAAYCLGATLLMFAGLRGLRGQA